MKKIAGLVTVIAAFALVMCLTGCSSEDSTNGNNNISSSSSSSISSDDSTNGNNNNISSNSSSSSSIGSDDSTNGNSGNSSSSSSISSDDSTNGNSISSSSNSSGGNNSSSTGNTNTLNLDRTVSFHGITLNVSSEWEEGTPQEFGDDGIVEYKTYASEDANGADSVNVQVQYFLWNLGTSPSDEFQIVKDYFSEDYPDFDGSPLDTRTVASSECGIYNISYTGDSGVEVSEQLAYIMSANCNYAIAVGGTCDHTEVMNAILDTVRIESS